MLELATKWVGGVWLLWATSALAIHVCYKRLTTLIENDDRATWLAIQYRDGTLDPLEPVRFYMRLRRYVFQLRGSTASAVVSWLKIAIVVFELSGALLLILTLGVATSERWHIR